MVLRVDLDMGHPSTMPATSARVRRVARQGWQKALENCSRVARSPSAAPISAALSRAAPPRSSRSCTVALSLL